MTANDAAFDHVRQEIADEYAKPYEKPWIVGFSGGKDSTLVVHLVIEHLQSLPRSERRRQVHVVANDTLVESPLVIDHIHKVLREIDAAASAFDLPVTTATTRPAPDQTYWVNLIRVGLSVTESDLSLVHGPHEDSADQPVREIIRAP